MTFDRLRLAVPKPVLIPFAKAAGLKPLTASSEVTSHGTPDQLINRLTPEKRTPEKRTASPSAQSISHLVVQWQGTPLSAEPALSRYSADYLVAMHDLVKRVAQIQASQIQTSHQLSPPPAQQAQSATDQISLTPAQILPSVAEIAEAVVLKQADWRAAPVEPSELAQQTAEWKLLSSHLLWRLTQSTHEALQLIEGSLAQVAEAGAWQSGILRLVVLLEFAPAQSVPGSAQAFDLVTAQPAPSLLPAARLLRIKTLLGQQPTSVAAYLQQLTRQLITAAPTLHPFFAGCAARWLIPHQHWQSGQLKLRLGLAFSPLDPSLESSADLKLADSKPAEPALITFSQPHWLEQHISVAVAQQLTQILLQVPLVADSPETVVKRAQTAIHELQNSLTLASRTFAQQAVTLDELAFRLLWGINRTAYEMMQLTSGLPVRLLEPQQFWAESLLRLALYLEVRTPQRRWWFDLARRASIKVEQIPNFLSAGLFQPESTALAQSDQHLWCLQPVELRSLESKFWQQIEQLAPEIALLRSETEVTVTAGEVQGQLGVVQLKAVFECKLR